MKLLLRWGRWEIMSCIHIYIYYIHRYKYRYTTYTYIVSQDRNFEGLWEISQFKVFTYYHLKQCLTGTTKQTEEHEEFKQLMVPWLISMTLQKKPGLKLQMTTLKNKVMTTKETEFNWFCSLVMHNLILCLLFVCGHKTMITKTGLWPLKRGNTQREGMTDPSVLSYEGPFIDCHHLKQFFSFSGSCPSFLA